MHQLPIIQANDLYYEIINNDNQIRILQGLNLSIAAAALPAGRI